MRARKLILAAVALITAVALAGCPAPTRIGVPSVPDNGGTDNNGPDTGVPGNVWNILWEFAADEHFQGLAVGENDIEVIFLEDEDFAFGVRTPNPPSTFEVRAIASPVSGQDISLVFEADLNEDHTWGAGFSILGDGIEGGFQAGDRITVTGAVIAFSGTTWSWWIDSLGGPGPVPGGDIAIFCPGHWDAMAAAQLVDPTTFHSADSAGAFSNWVITLTAGNVGNIEEVADLSDNPPVIAIGIRANGENSFRIDNVRVERFGPPPADDD